MASATRESFIASARVLLAQSGPHGMSLREVAAASGRSHALVRRYFGSKAGLVDAVAESLAVELVEVDEARKVAGTDAVIALLEWARQNRVGAQLLIRCALGDVPSGPITADAGPLRRLVEALGATPTSDAGSRARRSDVWPYAGASLALGWLTFDGFIGEAARMRPIAAIRRDCAMASAACGVAGMAGATRPELRLRRQAPGDRMRDARAAALQPDRPGDPRTALIDSAVRLFALHGPAAVTTPGNRPTGTCEPRALAPSLRFKGRTHRRGHRKGESVAVPRRPVGRRVRPCHRCPSDPSRVARPVAHRSHPRR